MIRCLWILLVVVLFSACKGESKKFGMVEIDAAVSEIFSDTTLTRDEKVAKCRVLLLDAYAAHKDDSIGLQVFKSLVSEFCSSQESLELYNESSDLIRNNETVKVKIASVKNESLTATGKTYLDIEGIDPLNGELRKLSSFIGGEKPVLVDFWASWCPPCREAIRGHLLELNQSGMVDIVGIAVWENSVDDTRKAMSELGITWPVVYTGGRQNSPTVKYGVRSIPTFVLIDSNGTVVARSNWIEDILKCFDKE
ncbi:MAG: TlpA disulfide reductase family protein [Bacteroidales bacterium]|nr:TlpA disulfide reductase family protein [Bacteroidales bacterium]